MSELLWRVAANILSRPLVVDLLIKQATKTPYRHLASADGQELYMARYWLLNPYDRETQQVKHRWLPWSARLHFIHRADQDPHLHDHPWNARTIILRGGYEEQRLLTGEDAKEVYGHVRVPEWIKRTSGETPPQICEYKTRLPGDTAPLKHGEFHKIESVEPGGAITLFITGKYRGPWGFLVDGVKVGWRKYLGLDDGQGLQSAEVCSKSPTGAHSEGLIKGDSGSSDEGLIGSGKCRYCSAACKELPDD